MPDATSPSQQPPAGDGLADRLRNANRLALALISAAARDDGAAVRVLLADYPESELTAALENLALLSAVSLMRELALSGVPADKLFEVLSCQLIELEF